VDALVRAGGAGADERAQGPRDPALAPDDLADVVGGDMEAEHGDAVALAPLHAHLGRVVDEAPRKLLDEALAQRCPFR
jgi:hypothetical protein